MQSWSIIIFVYNEQDAIKSVIESSLRVLNKLNQEKSELIIVNDGSIDNTLKIIQNFDDKRIRIINHTKNKGIGEALLSGYKAAQYENICAIPGDGQFNPEELIPFAEFDNNTFISFYRTQKTRYTVFRKILSLFNRILNRYFLNIKIRDVNWVKIYKKQFFDKITPVLTSSLVESEICAKMIRSGFKIIEVESTYHPRQGGVSKGASLKTIFLVLRETIKLYIALQKNG
ncbi:MAG: glycosyltransferase family 2 protein [Bacteroidales bacterium]|mgnify:CR=1 FL=1|jgi:glycosyltransferase involved in cell wall biosynthesis|nr:glycosyltransferase family 2 protein [Bacteroidales bacterium]HOL96942.1 glycosyltransferase family 2 protein [Bacteroidales bacterium]HOM36455.1 glycosyltransferase family 2 protein [Bacteroidales bacterium]HPD23966.1 glycosyltransferase family 2 protein [Bacteroidales bacterium]HRS98499.1 glycosyltransferase family 2 protein [Bacteroidales bacterium]